MIRIIKAYGITSRGIPVSGQRISSIFPLSDGFESDVIRTKRGRPYGRPLFGADDRTRTCTLARWNLNPMSLPIPPHPRIPLFLHGEVPEVGHFA